MHLDGDTPASERRRAIAGLCDGRLDVVCNCGLISEGVDVPKVGAIIMLRPTASVALYLQMVGRGLRPAPGKERALILDFAGNVDRHGLPDGRREWSLDAKPRRQRKASDGPRLRKCASCSALNRTGAQECSARGADLRTPRERVEIEMRLEQARRLEEEAALRRMTYREQLAWAGADERRLHFIRRLRGYKPGWVFFQLKEARERSRVRA